MNSNKFIPIIGLLIMLILAIGSISASDVDSESVGEAANMDLKVEEAVIDDSNVIEEENNAYAIADEETNDAYGIEDMENEADVENSLGSSQDEDVLASTVTFTESQYSTYFNGNGNIISGKLKAGDTLKFSGTFNKKIFIINIPLTITCTDGTVLLKDCGFRFISGSSGSNISNIKAKQISVADRPIIEAQGVTNLTFTNNDLFSNQSKSYPMTFNNITGFKIFYNKLQSNAYTESTGYSQPSAMVFHNAGNCNISGNTVITNDSYGIAFSGYSASSSMGSNPEDGSYENYIFNNTIHSVRELPSSYHIAIYLMCQDNIVINNTIYNAYKGIYATSSGNQIIGNTIHNIHGAYLSSALSEQGSDFAIYADSNSTVKDNLIYDCNFNDVGIRGAIHVGDNSNVTNNIIRNCNGSGIIIEGSNVIIARNNLNVTRYGIYTNGDHSNITIELNIVDSNNASAIHLEQHSRNAFPHDITIQNNILYSNSNDGAIYIDQDCTNIQINNTFIVGVSGNINENTHLINENNFDDYFLFSGSFNNKIKENDTLIFAGTFSSKGKLTINKKVTMMGINAVFKDTTFIISETEDVVMENIRIDNPNTNLADRLWGIQIKDSHNVTIKNCDISIYDPYSAFAVYVLDSSNCSIINSFLKAEGNYFTAALFSFNSTNITIDGNTIETIGSGDTYLVNNRSCLNTSVNGAIICPDGDIICVDGNAETGTLDGVIPGSHMISGLFRTYGALFVHTSNVNFTNNNVTVGSRLDPFYNLNESCNTIAGVFIHYGGFNNTISNNNINLNSNDPMIYAMGIIGASPNSTAEGSKNNSFIDNNISVRGPYHGVGIYLGYKAINSTFRNNITIMATNAIEKINSTLVENDENNIGGVFKPVIPHNTTLTVSDASYKWNNGNKYITVALKDANGTVVSNQNIVLSVDGKNYTGTTDTNGVAKIKVSISKTGTFDVVAYFYGEGILLASTNAGKLVLNKDSTSMSSAGKTYTVTTASKTITVTLRDGSGNLVANRKVAATVNGKTYYATTNSKGVATFKLSLNAVKTYTVSLKFAGDSYYTASSSSVKVKVTKTKTKLTVPKKTYKAKSKTKKLTATLKDQTGKAIKSKKVTFIVNKKKYTAKTNKKGVATVKVKLSKKKTYKFTVKFAGDKTYVAVKKTGKVKIK